MVIENLFERIVHGWVKITFTDVVPIWLCVYKQKLEAVLHEAHDRQVQNGNIRPPSYYKKLFTIVSANFIGQDFVVSVEYKSILSESVPSYFV